jgi:hypothetical protein
VVVTERSAGGDFDFTKAAKIAFVLFLLTLLAGFGSGRLQFDWALIPSALGMFIGALMLVYLVGIFGSTLKGRR